MHARRRRMVNKIKARKLEKRQKKTKAAAKA